MNPGISALRSTDFSDVLSFNRSTISLAHDLKVPDILRLLSSSIGATVCSCTLRREGWGKVDVAFHGLDATHQRMFKQKYFPRNSLTEWPESAEARKCLPVVANPTFVSNNSYISSEFYCQFMRPLGMHQIMVIILKSSSLHRVIGMWRSEDEKPFGQREQVKAELIVPALSAAIEETDPIGYLSHFGELIDIFDPFFDSDGFVVLSKDLKPLYMNGPAVELLSLLSTSNDAPECIGGRMLPRSLSAAIQARLALRDIEPSASGEVEFQLQSPRTAANVKVQLLPVRRECMSSPSARTRSAYMTSVSARVKST